MEDTAVMQVCRKSWRCVEEHDKDGWLALMADDICIEDPIGEAITNPDGLGVRGKEAVAAFYDANIAPNQLKMDCHETFPSSSPNEVSHVLSVITTFDSGDKAIVRGIFTYRVNDAGLLASLRGYWNMDAMRFESSNG